MKSCCVLLLMISMFAMSHTHTHLSVPQIELQPKLIVSSVQIGSFAQINPSVRIRANGHVGRSAKIGPYVKIGTNSKVGSDGSIQANTTIKSKVTLANFVNLGEANIVQHGASIASHVSTGSGVRIGKHVRIYDHVNLLDAVELADGCVLDKFTTIDVGSRIQTKVYIGQFVSLGKNVTVEQWAVIHNHVHVMDGDSIGFGDVIISPPTSYKLYLGCAPFSNTHPSFVDTATTRTDEIFNSLMESLIEKQFQELEAQCKHSRQNQKRIPSYFYMPFIKTVYLLRYYGKERFIEIDNILRSDGIRSSIMSTTQIEIEDSGTTFATHNSKFGPDTLRMLNNSDEISPIQAILNKITSEYHFGRIEEKTILFPKVQDAFVRLLAIEQDNLRKVRVKNDRPCDMMSHISYGWRKVKCSEKSSNLVVVHSSFII